MLRNLHRSRNSLAASLPALTRRPLLSTALHRHPSAVFRSCVSGKVSSFQSLFKVNSTASSHAFRLVYSCIIPVRGLSVDLSLTIPKWKKKQKQIREFTWEEGYTLFKDFKQKAQHDEVSVKSRYYPDLWRWVAKQRSLFALGKLPQDQVDLLNDIDFRWRPFKKWKENFYQLKDFKERFGHCRVPKDWEENYFLAEWVIRQRRLLPKRKLFWHGLSEEQIRLLDSLGFDWGLRSAMWEDKFSQLQTFVRRYGHTRVKWIVLKKLEESLEEEETGEETSDENKKEPDSNINSCSTPPLESYFEEDYEDDVQDRSNYAHHHTADQEDNDHVENYNDKEGDEGDEEEQELSGSELDYEDGDEDEFKLDNLSPAHLADKNKKSKKLRKPTKQELIDEAKRINSLYWWVVQQKKDYRNGKLKAVRKVQLDEIGFDWEHGQDASWHNMLDQLKAFKDQHGHIRVPMSPQWKSLRYWLCNQKLLFQQNRLDQERASALDKLDVFLTWDDLWNQRFEKLQQFKQEHGHLDIPSVGEHAALSKWLHAQKQIKRAGRMPEEREKLLQELGVDCGKKRQYPTERKKGKPKRTSTKP